jgi:hypothetical protein
MGARDSLFWRTAGKNAGEDRFCCGGAPARRGTLDHNGADRVVIDGKNISVICDHFGPQETSELSRDRCGNDRAHVLMCTQLTEPRRQTGLRLPRPRNCGWQSITLTFCDARADTWAVLIRPRGFAQLGAQMRIAGTGDVTAVLALSR